MSERMRDVFPEDFEPWTTTTKGGVASTSSSALSS